MLSTLLVLALVPASTVLAQRPLTPDQRIAHLLNRTTFGIRAGDVERVRAMGIDAYLEAQLHPDRIPDPVADAKLASYSVLAMTLEEAMHYERPAAGIANRRRDAAFRVAPLTGRGRGTSATTDTLDRDSSAAMRRSLRNIDVSPMVTRANRPEEAEIYDARLIRAVYSERQLAEVMVEFWFNHFNIRVPDTYQVTHWTEHVIRPHAMGKFEDLLFATATHPAMMLYLDNWLSAAPDSVVRARLATWQPPNGAIRELEVRRRAEFFARTKGLNENYARELMELHTLGVNGGYTQKDVQQVAKAFTGWTIEPVALGVGGGFYYEPLLHETGDKVVLGHAIKSGGMDEGKEILRILARHPSTARYVSFKLARHFVSDDPPDAVVEAAARTFRETGGDIPSVLRTIFRSPEFYSPQYHQAKIKKPLEFVASALRVTNAEIEFASSARREGTVATLSGGRAGILTQMGQPMGQRETPDGYPDVAAAWMSTSALQQRMNFSLALTSGQLPGIRADVASAERAFRELGYPAPTPAQMSQAQAILAQRAARGAAGAGGRMGAEGMMGGGAEAAQGKPGAARAPSPTELLSIAAAIYLGSPQFQKR
jgi:uncharacterized protein (DUF1800 family)